MRRGKKLLGLVTAVATVQGTLFSGAATLLAEENDTTEKTELSGVESVLQNPFSDPCVKPQQVSTPEAVEARTDTDGNTAFTFTEEGITVEAGEATGYEVDGTQLTINKAGTYYISGICSDGAIKIKKKTTGVVLVLNGVSLTSEATAPLVMASDTEVQLVVYGENVLADTELNNDETHAENEAAENAVIKAKSGSSLTICGGGKLTVEGNAKNAVKSNGTLVIDDVIMDVDAADNGISNEKSIVINGGYIDIKSQGDGMKSAADDAPEGSVTINDGTLLIDSMADGIQATKDILIKDGIVHVKTYGGAEAEYDGDDEAYPSAKGLKASGSYEVTVNEETMEVDATGCSLSVSGGTLVLDCADDAIHSDGDVTLTGGYCEIASGDDGVHADGITTIGKKDGTEEDLYLYISNSFEGIEGAEIYMNSGTTRVFAMDDGVNAANSDLRNYDFKLEVNGGNHYIACSEGDGFDSNGTLMFHGGISTILASSGAGEGDPLDSETDFDITDGTVLAIGTYSPMGGIPKNDNYVQYGAPAGMNGNQPGGGMGGDQPQMPGVSGDAVGGNPPQMPGVSGDAVGGNPPQMPGVSGDAVGGNPPQMPGVSGDVVGGNQPQMPGVSGDAVGGNQPQMPGVSGDALGGEPSQMPGGVQSNISIKNGDTVVVADASGQAVAAAVTAWLPDASAYSASYVLCWSKNITSEEEYGLYVNGEYTASSKDTDSFGGDLNQDGQVTLEDAYCLLKAALHIEELENVNAGDINGDGKIALDDVVTLLQRILKVTR